MRRRLAAALAAPFLCLSLPEGAFAATVFAEDFETENSAVSAVNFGAFSQFSVVDGSVDYLGARNPWGLSCAGGSKGCVDLDGTTASKVASQFVSRRISFNPGTYSLAFDLGGNQRMNRSDTLEISVGDLLSRRTLTLDRDAPFRTYSFNFTVGAATVAAITFRSPGPSDFVGLILDNVRITDGAPSTDVVETPLPAALLLMLAGLGGIAALPRRRAG